MREIVIAVDLGATNIRVGVFDVKNKYFLEKTQELTKVSEGPQAISLQVVENVKKTLSKWQLNNKILGIGVIAPGPVDLKRGGLIRSTNIPYEFVPVMEPLEEEFKLPIGFMHDAKASALAEYMFGAGKTMNTEYLAFITISTGIGGGIIDGGKLIIGADGNAGEVGCTLVDYRGRMRCGCGSYGHWQAYASGSSIPRYVKYLVEDGRIKLRNDSLLLRTSNNLTKFSAKVLYECAKKGDPIALEIIDELAIINAAGIANVINAFNPEVLTLGGPIVLNNVELTIEKIIPRLQNYLRVRMPKLIPTPLGLEIGLYGAVAVLLQKMKAISSR
ncbi:MAG: ROK family protein [Candidatus Aenigmarchaeota archaeon]|nr:ROK family protein [Candidatus Aenigmarchaeota archaeon]